MKIYKIICENCEKDYLVDDSEEALPPCPYCGEETTDEDLDEAEPLSEFDDLDRPKNTDDIIPDSTPTSLKQPNPWRDL